MYKIVLKKSAAKEFLQLPNEAQTRIERAFLLLSNEQWEQLDIKILLPKDEKRYRLRVGDYRIIFHFENQVCEILVLKIWKRWDVYK